MEVSGVYVEVMGIAQPLGLLRTETPNTLKKKIEELDGEEEFLSQWRSDRPRTMSMLVAHFDPNALLNPAERAFAVAAWKPPLWKHLGFRGTFDPKAQRIRIESEGRLLADEPVAHSCHVAVAWNKVLSGQGLEVLLLDLGTDDESFLAVVKASAERIRTENILAVARPCPLPKK